MKQSQIESFKTILKDWHEPFEETVDGIVISITTNGLKTIYELLVATDGVSIICHKKASLNLPQSADALENLSELLQQIACAERTPSIAEIKQSEVVDDDKADELLHNYYTIPYDSAEEVYKHLFGTSGNYNVVRNGDIYIVYKDTENV